MKNLLSKLFFIYAAAFFASYAAFFYFLRNSQGFFLPVLIALMMAAALTLFMKFFLIRPLEDIQMMIQRMKDGDFQVSSRPSNLNIVVSNLQDLSASLQKRILEITEDKNELKAMLSSMVEGVVIIDKYERILLASPPVSSMLDFRSKEAEGRRFWEIIRNEEINSSLSEALQKKSAIRKEFSIYFPQESFFSMQISPFFNQGGGLAGLVAVFHDITELKRLERLRSEFVANVSHELKTPLTSIKGYAETLQAGALDDEKSAKRFIDIIRNQAERLEDLVNDLLTLSSLESKEAEIRCDSVSIYEAIESAINASKWQSEKKKQKLSTMLPEDLPLVYADRVKLEHVFGNLIDNAIKFSPDGGKIFIRGSEEKDYIRIDVEDSGIGISEEHLPRIFERFYRVDKSRSREMGGTGLGLSIVKHIVLAHNGKVSVVSKPQEGSTFSVYLPKI